jgi:hypothetical protein
MAVSQEANINAYLIAGVISGITGLLVFLVIHHFWIQPIWFILPIGLIISAVGGTAVGWAYRELSPGLPHRPWTALALAAFIALILLPSILLAQLRQPLFDPSVPGGRLTVSTSQAVIRFVLELLLTSAVMGGLAGWWLSRTWHGSLVTALAGFIFALGPGHNIPFLGNTPGVDKGLAILAAVVLVSSVVLVEGHFWLGKR